MTFLLVVIVFGGMVFLHELGHFLASKAMKIEVEEFGFGLPPRLFTMFTWKGTAFTLNLLPFGGFVRPKGENDPNVLDGLAAANPWKRVFVLLAGPVMNLTTAVLVTAIIIASMGIAIPGKVMIGDVMPDSPAAEAGILAQDIVVSINGQNVGSIEEAKAIIQSNLDQELTMSIDRSGELMNLVSVPSSTRTAQEGALGVGLTYPTRKAGVLESISAGAVYTIQQAGMILYLPIGLIQGAIAPDEARLVGMKGIYDMFDQAAERDTVARQEQAAGNTNTGAYNVLLMVAMLSTSLGVFNLLPIPALDGGRILFAIPEIVFKKRMPYILENYVNGIAMLLLIALMVYINAMDFINPINLPTP